MIRVNWDTANASMAASAALAVCVVAITGRRTPDHLPTERMSGTKTRVPQRNGSNRLRWRGESKCQGRLVTITEQEWNAARPVTIARAQSADVSLGGSTDLDGIQE